VKQEQEQPPPEIPWPEWGSMPGKGKAMRALRDKYKLYLLLSEKAAKAEAAEAASEIMKPMQGDAMKAKAAEAVKRTAVEAAYAAAAYLHTYIPGRIAAMTPADVEALYCYCSRATCVHCIEDAAFVRAKAGCPPVKPQAAMKAMQAAWRQQHSKAATFVKGAAMKAMKRKAAALVKAATMKAMKANEDYYDRLSREPPRYHEGAIMKA